MLPLLLAPLLLSGAPGAAAAAVESSGGGAQRATAPTPLTPSLQTQPWNVLYEWVSLNYTWTSPQQMQDSLASGQWVPENNVIAGVKYWNGTLYVSVPRWRHGVPSTLNSLAWPGDGAAALGSSPLLSPFPSWEAQDISNPNANPAAIWYVQSMEITPAGVMWILDVGRLNIFDSNSSLLVNGPPKLILFDIPSNTTLSTFIFPDSVASWSQSFLNDLVLDQTTGTAYISDAGPASGGIVVYDSVRGRSRRFSGFTTMANMSVPFTINGIDYPSFNTPTDGIALSADRSTLFYCALRGSTLYALPSAALRDWSLSNDQLNALVLAVTAKPPSDGMATSASGQLFWGSLTEDAVYQWLGGGAGAPPASSLPAPAVPQEQLLVQDAAAMQWPDTFAWGPAGQLLVSFNRLQLFFTYTMDWSGASGANMRIVAVQLQNAEEQGYLAGQPAFDGGSCGGAGGAGGGSSSSPSAAVTGLAVTTALLAAGLVWLVHLQWQAREGKERLRRGVFCCCSCCAERMARGHIEQAGPMAYSHMM